jgi:hypothetical protein
LKARASGVRDLPLLHDLKSLWCFNVGESELEAIGRCTSLESLYIDGLRADSIRALLGLGRLRILSLENCSKIASIPDLEPLQNLRGLSLSNFSKVHDLGPLGRLHRLVALAVSGSMWKTMTVASFSPLKALTELRWLHLTNIKVADESLEPLQGMLKLKRLEIANFYSTREFARLAVALASTECTWFKPIVDINFAQCGQCGGRKVMLTGKGASSLCPNCKSARINAHIAEWKNASCSAA